MLNVICDCLFACITPSITFCRYCNLHPTSPHQDFLSKSNFIICFSNMVVSTSNRYPLRFCEVLCLFFLIGYITFLGTIACNSGVASIFVHTQISLTFDGKRIFTMWGCHYWFFLRFRFSLLPEIQFIISKV